jgi:hypothetical protein
VLSFFGSSPRLAAIIGNCAAVLSRVLGLGGSSSRITRSISSNAALRTRSCSSGVDPVSSSYNSTPSE